MVTTGEHKFFLPAQKMYVSCGFKETRRFFGDTDLSFREIEFTKKIDDLTSDKLNF